VEKFKIIEHIADVGVEVYGKDLNELFENSAHAMLSIMFSEPVLRSGESIQIEIEEPSLEQLLHSWLSELLYRFSVDEITFSHFTVDVNNTNFTLKARVFFEKFDEKKYFRQTEIKAVTYYQLKIDECRDAEGNLFYKARIIFDV